MTFQLEYEERLTGVYGQLFPARPGEEHYDSAVERYEALQRGRSDFMDSLTLLYPGLYATRIMNAFRAPVVRGSMTHPQRIDTLKLHFFDAAPIDDPGLLYAPVYTYRIVDYLSLYSVDTFTMEQQEAQFVEAVDQIMMHVSLHPALRSFVVEFMLEGFELLGMEQVQIHLAEQYLDESCESEVAELVRTRMEGYKKMVAGATAPDFAARDTDGKNHILSEIPNPYTLVVFWASTCGHCRDLIPELRQWYMEENTLDVEVVSISIDSSTALFRNYVTEEPMPWITVHDPAGWQGRVASLYQVYATPSLFLVDRERTILARPASFRQLQRTLKKLN
jgi:peroxiredoxin